MDWEELLTRTLPHVDLVHPSIDELLFMLDRGAHSARQAGATVADVVDLGRLANLADRLLSMGAAVVSIKLDSLGLYVRGRGDARRVRSFCERVGARPEQWLDAQVL